MSFSAALNKKKCQACFDSGFWCRGCGGTNKKKALKNKGYGNIIVDLLYNTQFSSCGEETIPCFLCNLCDPHKKSKNPNFWFESFQNEHFAFSISPCKNKEGISITLK